MKPHHQSFNPRHHKRNATTKSSSPILYIKTTPPPEQPPSVQHHDFHESQQIKPLSVPLQIESEQPPNSKPLSLIKKKKKRKYKRKDKRSITELPCEILLNIVEYLESHEFIHMFLICWNVTNKLNENSQFYKLLLIRTIQQDIALYGRYLQERIRYNGCAFPFDIKSTCFKARGIVQWKNLIKRREEELDKLLNKKRKSLKDWKKVYDGYSNRRTIENVLFRVKTISKACWKNERSLILVLKLVTQLRETLLKLEPEWRKYIVQRNYGKRIKRGHTLFHQIVYLIGNYADVRFNYQQIEPFIPYLKFLIGCCSDENPLFVRNSYNYSGMDYVLRIGNYSFVSEMVNSYSDLLNQSDLAIFERKPILFSMIKNKISSSVIKRWIDKLEFPKSVLLIRNNRQMNILHYLCNFVFKFGTLEFSQFLHLLSNEFSKEEIIVMLNARDDLDETPLSKLLSKCEENQRNARVGIINLKNLNRLYGLVNMMCVHLGYDMSDEEVNRWNNVLSNNDKTFGDSYLKFYLSVETIELLRNTTQYQNE